MKKASFRTVAGILFAVLPILSISATPKNHKLQLQKENPMASLEQCKSIMQRLVAGESMSTKEIMEYGKLRGASNALIAMVRDSRLSALNVIVELGRPILPEDAKESIPERPGPIVTDTAVIAYVVSLMEDSDAEIRTQAFQVLGELVPAPNLKPHTQQIIAAIQRYPVTTGALILLGKTDSFKALELLNANQLIGSTSSDDALMVRARLGDTHAENAVVEAYEKAADVGEKMALAPRLGYIASKKTLHALATEMRSPEFIYWNQKSRRSLRVDIIKGFHLAFPTEPLFWEPFYRPTDDGYYEGIEKWLEKKTGVAWTRSRPPFLYLEDAPSPPPPKR